MKFLVLAACVALTSAQPFFGLTQHPNGAIVPLDEPAVAAARAEHLAAKGAVYGAVAPLAPSPLAAATLAYATNYGYAGPLNLNTQLVGHPNGAVVPLDEPAVAAARAEHLAAKGAVYAATAPVLAAAPAVAAPLSYAGYAGPLAGVPALVAHPNGAVVPVDEPAVAAARAEHLATKGVYGGVYAPVANTIAATPAVYAPHAGLVAHPNGAVVPVDEPAVAKARAEHLSLLH